MVGVQTGSVRAARQRETRPPTLVVSNKTRVTVLLARPVFLSSNPSRKTRSRRRPINNRLRRCYVVTRDSRVSSSRSRVETDGNLQIESYFGKSDRCSGRSGLALVTTSHPARSAASKLSVRPWLRTCRRGPLKCFVRSYVITSVRWYCDGTGKYETDVIFR